MAEAPNEPSSSEPSRKGIRARTADLAARAESARRSAEQRAEMLRRRHASVRLAYDAYDHDRRHAGALLAGGIAYRLFLWLLPLSLVAVSAVGLVADVATQSPEDIASRAGLPAALAATVAQAAGSAGRGSFGLLLLGLWLLVWAGKSVVKALRLVAAVSWQISPGPLARGFRASLAFSGVALILLASPIVMQPLYSGPFLVDLVAWIGTTALAALLFAWLLGTLPGPEGIGWTDLLPGALLLAVGMQVLRIVTEIYFVGRLDRVDDLYGALGIAAVLMVWLFVIGRLLVAALTLNAERGRARTEPRED